MSVRSELVAASRSEAPSVAENESPSQDWPGIVCHGLDQIKLASLWNIVAGDTARASNVVEHLKQIELAAGDPDKGPWVHALPEPLRDGLADLSDADEERLRKTAAAWAATNEMKGCQADAVDSLLQELADLADLAREEELDLLLRVSL